MRFLDVKTDYAFKKVFGSSHSKSKLISFLNSIVYENSKVKIKDLDIVDPYNIPMIKGMKDTFVDVKALLDDETNVIIEMQVIHHTAFDKRVLYNAAKNYSIQLNKAEDYHLLNPVIALSIVDFTMFENDNLINRFKLLEKDTFINYSDDIELIFVELPKFLKSENELSDIKDQWIYFIKNAGSLEYIPAHLDETIKNALDTVNEANLSKDELEAQHKRKEFISIQKLAIMKAKNDGLEQGREEGIEQGREEGIEQGREEGIEQGIEQERVNIILNSIKQGVEEKTISLITGVNISEIQKIKREMKL
jgi:predicted transposase/invertase (TIGR01784 family)